MFAKFTGKYLCHSLFLIQLWASGMPATLLKKSPWHRCLPVSFEKLLRPPFLQNTSAWLLLNCVFSESWVFYFSLASTCWCFSVVFLTLLYIERTIFAPYISLLKLNRLEHISSKTFFWNKLLLLSFPKLCVYTQLVNTTVKKLLVITETIFNKTDRTYRDISEKILPLELNRNSVNYLTSWNKFYFW